MISRSGVEQGLSTRRALSAGQPTEKSMQPTDGRPHDVFETPGRGDGRAGATPQEQVPNLRWKAGVELPPFISSNIEAVRLCEAILLGVVVEFPTIVVSEAVAIQIYRLIFDVQRCANSLKRATWADLYLILASLARRELVVVAAQDAVDRLRLLVARKASRSQPPGLDGALRERVKARKREPEPLCSMTAEEATAHLLLQWDCVPLDFSFGGASAGSADGGSDGRGIAGSGVASSGGGGDDPGGGEGGTGEVDPRPPPAVLEHMDVRTRALDSALGMRGRALLAASKLRGPPSPWVEGCGMLLPEILGLIDLRVRATPLSLQSKRELSWQQKAIQERQQVDRERGLRCAAELELVKMALQPHRDRRLLEYERRRRQEANQEAADAMEGMQAAMRQQAKEMRAAHAAELTQLRGDERAARVAIEELLLRVKVENTELERKLRCAAASSSPSLRPPSSPPIGYCPLSRATTGWQPTTPPPPSSLPPPD